MVILEILPVQEYRLYEGNTTAVLNLDGNSDGVSERFTFVVKTGSRVSSEALSRVVGMGSNMQDLELPDTVVVFLSSSSVMVVHIQSRGGCPMGTSYIISGHLKNSWKIIASLSSKTSLN